MPTLIIYIILHYSFGLLGILANIILLVVILGRTPTKMKNYGTVLAASAVVDFLAAVTGFATFVKNEISFIEAFTGPCAALGSISFCLTLYVTFLCATICSIFNIAHCFYYRLHAIRSGPLNGRRRVWAFIVLFAANILNAGIMYQVDLEFSDSVKIRLAMLNRDVESNFIYFAFRDDYNIVKIGIPTLNILAYLIIVVLFVKIRRSLADVANKMSKQTAKAHQEIVKGLIIQSCLPVLSVFSALHYVVAQSYEYRSDFVGYEGMCSEVLSVMHPLISLYFVRPYRVAVLNLVSQSKISHVHDLS